MENVKFKNLVHTQACIKAFELQHHIVPPFQDNLSFNYLSACDPTASVWKPPVFDKTDPTLVSVHPMDPMRSTPVQAIWKGNFACVL
jgi:hypothetical protein